MPVQTSDPTSAWITGRQKALKAVQRVLGKSAYVGRAGTFTGGANGVFWLDVLIARPAGQVMIANVLEHARKKVTAVQAAIEQDLVFPLLRGADVTAWAATPSFSILLTHEKGQRLKAIPEEKMQREFPKTFSYLKRFEAFLRKRAALKRYFTEEAPFYSIFNIGDYSFEQWKVVWREQAAGLTAAVIGPANGRPVMPDHKLMMVAMSSRSEAHYLCAALNSAPAKFAVGAYAVDIQMDTHILENLAIPRFTSKEETHVRLSELSLAAHEAVRSADDGEVRQIEEKIDQYMAKVWGLSDEELAEIKRSLEEL
jgi:hypothetical protein